MNPAPRPLPRKLTEAEEAAIRASTATQLTLAARYGVSQSLISRITRRHCPPRRP